MDLSCPSGIAGNLFATACTLLGVPAETIAALPGRLGLPEEFQAVFDGHVWDGDWAPGSDPRTIGGAVGAMPGAAIAALGASPAGELAARILRARWAHDPQQEAYGETWCDTVFDACAAAVSLEYLGWPPVTVHGSLPRGAEHAVAGRLLSDWDWQPSALRMELVTPTGAAILHCVAVQQPASAWPCPGEDGTPIAGRFTRAHALEPMRVRAGS